MGLYNGIYKLKDYTYKTNQTFKFLSADLKLLKTIKYKTKIFKTLSPILVNKKGDNLKFLCPKDAVFQEALNFSVKEVCSHFLNIVNPEFDIKFIKHQKMVITHFNQYMTTNKGIIEIAANPEILQLLYDVGIGVRRSQGFGMLEIIF
ncbi:MAG TPA: CRISPR-associated endoribonuclease Cas6 [Bacteroidales bacterium]|nr:CRISPR-associated endoribonuclease Cas6 [Bacteroidales bacterium]HOL97685.1 CRISPR-associated endoribonuclease Cas6 [Bacteroidales bacterium]HRT00353.1 CRISPR-associated endoribonuclease Cas6 [Bacteroidales bacterium]HUM32536.1 CRISPR-associated endoribonuclease Cas6 [Bacteroidales bacterium]